MSTNNKNKRVLEVFFDYACPYCMRGHAVLKQLLSEFEDIEAVFRPCESHPRPERYGRHSDLCIRAMYYAMEKGADMEKWHDTIYDAIHVKGVNVEDEKALAECCAELVNPTELLYALRHGAYEDELKQANHYAYEKSGVWVVPAYRMDGRSLNVKEDVDVTRGALENFLKK